MSWERMRYLQFCFLALVLMGGVWSHECITPVPPLAQVKRKKLFIAAVIAFHGICPKRG